MLLPLLSSVHNPKVRDWKSLCGPAKERRRQGLFLAEGEHMAGEALGASSCRLLLVREDVTERYRALIRQAEDDGMIYFKTDYENWKSQKGSNVTMKSLTYLI